MSAGRIIAQKYRLGGEIGRGGMGSVYEGAHTSTTGRVAVKIMRAPESGEEERGRIARFQREAVIVGQLDTKHVVKVFDAGFDDATNEPFIVMELLEGEDLSQLLKRIGPLRVDLAIAVISHACAGLAKAHETGVVHRDIKPGNLFLARAEFGEHVVKVLDFGIAKVKKVGDSINAEGMTLTQTGALVGSPFYMSPEQARGRKTIDHRADVWSLGVVLHKLIAGRTPFEGASTLGEVIIAICSEEPTSLREHAPWAPPLVVEVVRRALRRNPDERFATTLEMLEALKPLLPNGPRITDDMIVPLPAELRAQLATLPRALDRSLTEGESVGRGAAISQMTPSPGSSPLPLGGPPSSSLQLDSGAGLAATRVDVPQPRPARGALIALIAVFVTMAIVGSGLGVVAMRRSAVDRLDRAEHARATSGASGASAGATAPPSATDLGAAAPSPSSLSLPPGDPASGSATGASAAGPISSGAAARAGARAQAGSGGTSTPGSTSAARAKGQPTGASSSAGSPKAGAPAAGRLSGGVGGDVPF